jgi:hypothetical protein
MGIEQKKDTEEIMHALGNGIDEFFKENIGYTAMPFSFSPSVIQPWGIMSLMSNERI